MQVDQCHMVPEWEKAFQALIIEIITIIKTTKASFSLCDYNKPVRHY